MSAVVCGKRSSSIFADELLPPSLLSSLFPSSPGGQEGPSLLAPPPGGASATALLPLPGHGSPGPSPPYPSPRPFNFILAGDGEMRLFLHHLVRPFWMGTVAVSAISSFTYGSLVRNRTFQCLEAEVRLLSVDLYLLLRCLI